MTNKWTIKRAFNTHSHVPVQVRIQITYDMAQFKLWYEIWQYQDQKLQKMTYMETKYGFLILFNATKKDGFDATVKEEESWPVNIVACF